MWTSFRGPSSSAKRNASSITSSLMGSLSVQQPKDQRHDGTDHEARRDREIEAEVSALDHDVAGQPTEPELAEPRPQQPDRYQHQAHSDEPPAHDPTPAFAASRKPRNFLR